MVKLVASGPLGTLADKSLGIGKMMMQKRMGFAESEPERKDFESLCERIDASVRTWYNGQFEELTVSLLFLQIAQLLLNAFVF